VIAFDRLDTRLKRGKKLVFPMRKSMVDTGTACTEAAEVKRSFERLEVLVFFYGLSEKTKRYDEWTGEQGPFAKKVYLECLAVIRVSRDVADQG